jgi:hypothetical protein
LFAVLSVARGGFLRLSTLQDGSYTPLHSQPKAFSIAFPRAFALIPVKSLRNDLVAVTVSTFPWPESRCSLQAGEKTLVGIPPRYGDEHGAGHFRYFVAAAEEGSLTAAVSGACIRRSRQIRDLEYDVGVQLLTRGARGIKLTSAGQAFLDHARQALRPRRPWKLHGGPRTRPSHHSPWAS